MRTHPDLGIPSPCTQCVPSMITRRPDDTSTRTFFPTEKPAHRANGQETDVGHRSESIEGVSGDGLPVAHGQVARAVVLAEFLILGRSVELRRGALLAHHCMTSVLTI